jgi:hypothetical protein
VARGELIILRLMVSCRMEGRLFPRQDRNKRKVELMIFDFLYSRCFLVSGVHFVLRTVFLFLRTRSIYLYLRIFISRTSKYSKYILQTGFHSMNRVNLSLFTHFHIPHFQVLQVHSTNWVSFHEPGQFISIYAFSYPRNSAYCSTFYKRQQCRHKYIAISNLFSISSSTGPSYFNISISHISFVRSLSPCLS